VIQIDAPGSPVSGSMFSGNSSTGGAWYTNTSFPPQFRNTYFHADYIGQWIKSFVFTADNRPTAVQNFTSNAGSVVAIAVEPATGHLYYIEWSSALLRVRYAAASNQPPVAAAASDKWFGAAPLTVQFSSAGSRDPEGQSLQYRWTFGDGTSASSDASPSHTFNAPAGVATNYIVRLVVTDVTGLSATNRLIISANNTPPRATITSPVDGTRYSVSNGTKYACVATVTDAEHPRSELRYAWQTILHHDEHQHLEAVDTNRATTTVISPTGCDGPTYFYRVVLTVTDPLGLSTTNEVRLYPDCLTTNNGPETLIAAGAVWRYLDNGSNPGTGWRGLAFNDSSWQSGPAQLGYGDQDEATEVSYGPFETNKHITTYFRRSFVATNASYGGLTVRFVRDDGLVMYVNGTEALRNNMPTNTIVHTTLALTNVAGTNESLWLRSALNPALLREGTNVVAVEVHQITRASIDISFDLELIGLRVTPQPFLRAALLSGGRVRLSFHGDADASYITEASTNLSQWSAIATNSAGGGNIEYMDLNASSGRRFFRVRQVQ
jgi:PKD repeat protein